MKKTLAIAAAVLVASAACSAGDDRVEPTPPDTTPTTVGEGDTGGATADQDGDPVIDIGEDDVVLTAGLVRFDGCGPLIDYLHTEYLARVGPWGFNRGGWERPAFRDGTDVGDLFEEGGIAEESASVEGVDYSGTNVQEAGVDEADIVKTDGRRIFTLSSGQLVVVDASGRTRTGTVTVAEGWGRELFIDGDSLLVITRSTSDAPDGSETVIQRIDVSGRSPEIVETLNVQGSYISARSVGGTARVILRYDPQWNFPFVYPESEAGADAAREANRAAVSNSTLDDWLPHYALDAADSSTGPRLTSCDDVHAPSVFSGFGMTTVVSVPIDGDFDPSESSAVMAPGDTVYASLDSLYVATTRWVESEAFDDEAAWEDAWRQRRTSLHRFDISGDEADYESSGAVLGVIHNQFSLSEHNGHLRVVTTIGDPWGDESESHVRVLSTDGDVLVEVGSVGDIGRGEQVQSVRFVGDVGYVVTFRQIDPFYTVDLSDPADPTIVGELKIPGFSSYLHPISDTLVLGVGSDADEDGRVTGAKISLFDVSDLTAPREVTVWTAPDGWNDVGWDHRAFLWWAPEDLAVIPLRVWEADREWSGAVALRVAEGAITEARRIEHTPGAALRGGAGHQVADHHARRDDQLLLDQRPPQPDRAQHRDRRRPVDSQLPAGQHQRRRHRTARGQRPRHARAPRPRGPVAWSGNSGLFAAADLGVDPGDELLLVAGLHHDVARAGEVEHPPLPGLDRLDAPALHCPLQLEADGVCEGQHVVGVHHDGLALGQRHRLDGAVGGHNGLPGAAGVDHEPALAASQHLEPAPLGVDFDRRLRGEPVAPLDYPGLRAVEFKDSEVAGELRGHIHPAAGVRRGEG